MRNGHQRRRDTAIITKSDGTQCSNEDETLSRWKEHYEAALNFPPATHCPDLDSLSTTTPEDPLIKVDPPTFNEVKQAVNKLKNGRAAGSDKILPEILKAGGDTILSAMVLLFEQVGHQVMFLLSGGMVS